MSGVDLACFDAFLLICVICCGVVGYLTRAISWRTADSALSISLSERLWVDANSGVIMAGLLPRGTSTWMVVSLVCLIGQRNVNGMDFVVVMVLVFELCQGVECVFA